MPSNASEHEKYKKRIDRRSHISVWVDNETSEDINAICEAAGCSRSELMRFYIEQMIRWGKPPPGLEPMEPK